MNKLMIDIDGVLADFISGFTMVGWTLFGTPSYTVDKQQYWDGFDGLTKEQVGDIWKAVHVNPKFWESLQACVSQSVFDRLDDLIEDGEADVYFVTNRKSRGAKRQTENWLLDHGITRPTVIISGKKGETAKALGIHYSIEDKAENADCIAWLTEGKTQSFILDRPYNRGQHAPHSSKVARVQTVDQFLSQIVPRMSVRETIEPMKRSGHFFQFLKWPTY